MKKSSVQDEETLRPAYQRSDFGAMIRGKYAFPPKGASNSVGGDVAQESLDRHAIASMDLTFACAHQADGRWAAEVPQLPGVMAYGATAVAAIAKAQALALRRMAELIEQDLGRPVNLTMSIPKDA